MGPQIERRGSILRRDLQDLVRTPDGHVSESKAWSNAGKFVAVYLLLHHSEYIIERTDALMVLLCIVVLPDLVKRIIEAKYPAMAK